MATQRKRQSKKFLGQISDRLEKSEKRVSRSVIHGVGEVKAMKLIPGPKPSGFMRSVGRVDASPHNTQIVDIPKGFR
jgi:hypothetical protein